MAKQIPGQMSLFDIKTAENNKKPQKTALNVKKCGSCIHMKRSTYGLMEYHGWACFGLPDCLSRSSDPQQAACEYYEPKGDCSTCHYRVWLHRDGKAYQACTYAGGGMCHYEKREEADNASNDNTDR